MIPLTDSTYTSGKASFGGLPLEVFKNRSQLMMNGKCSMVNAPPCPAFYYSLNSLLNKFMNYGLPAWTQRNRQKGVP